MTPYKSIDLHTKEAAEYIAKDLYLKNLDLNLYNGEVLIDTDTNNIIGRFLVSTGIEKGYIGAVRVYNQYQGQGFGDVLIEDAINKYNGYDLLVDVDNNIAQSLYSKHGFKRIGYSCDGNAFWMSLE